MCMPSAASSQTTKGWGAISNKSFDNNASPFDTTGTCISRVPFVRFAVVPALSNAVEKHHTSDNGINKQTADNYGHALGKTKQSGMNRIMRFMPLFHAIVNLSICYFICYFICIPVCVRSNFWEGASYYVYTHISGKLQTNQPWKDASTWVRAGRKLTAHVKQLLIQGARGSHIVTLYRVAHRGVARLERIFHCGHIVLGIDRACTSAIHCHHNSEAPSLLRHIQVGLFDPQEAALYPAYL